MKTITTVILGVIVGWACSGLLDKLAVYIHTNWR